MVKTICDLSEVNWGNESIFTRAWREPYCVVCKVIVYFFPEKLLYILTRVRILSISFVLTTWQTFLFFCFSKINVSPCYSRKVIMCQFWQDDFTSFMLSFSFSSSMINLSYVVAVNSVTTYFYLIFYLIFLPPSFCTCMINVTHMAVVDFVTTYFYLRFCCRHFARVL